METMTLLDLRNAVINEASIDGQSGTNGRHSPASLNALINRYWRSVRSLVAQSKGPWFQTLDAITAIPAATANEDFIEIDFPVLAIEILGVDVQVGTGGALSPKWSELDPADWTQRRLLNFQMATPEGGVGWWAIKQLPEARASTSVTTGKIALFPASLSGNYRVTFLEQFTDATADGHLFVGQTDWFTWVINSIVMVVSKRDHNKKDTFNDALVAKNDAEARIKSASPRVQRAGAVVPMRVGGERF